MNIKLIIGLGFLTMSASVFADPSHSPTIHHSTCRIVVRHILENFKDSSMRAEDFELLKRLQKKGYRVALRDYQRTGKPFLKLSTMKLDTSALDESEPNSESDHDRDHDIDPNCDLHSGNDAQSDFNFSVDTHQEKSKLKKNATYQLVLKDYYHYSSGDEIKACDFVGSWEISLNQFNGKRNFNLLNGDLLSESTFKMIDELPDCKIVKGANDAIYP